MRIVLWAYLLVYGIVVCGAAVTIWRSGLIDYLDRVWTLALLTAALALGVLLAIVSGLFHPVRESPTQADGTPRE